MTDQQQTPTLYERLGGAMGIAAVMDVLTNRLFDNASANLNPYVAKMHQVNSRPGFMWMVTAWSIEVTGGPKVYPGKNMVDAHADMVTNHFDFDVVALEIAATLSFCGVAPKEAKEYLAIIESYRADVLTHSVGKPGGVDSLERPQD